MNFYKEIDRVIGVSNIESVVLGQFPKYSDYKPETSHVEGKILTIEEARQYLDYDYHNGFGGEDCHPVAIWTKTHVYYIHEYDGSTRLGKAPRHPIEHMPKFSGDTCGDEYDLMWSNHD